MNFSCFHYCDALSKEANVSVKSVCETDRMHQDAILYSAVIFHSLDLSSWLSGDAESAPWLPEVIFAFLCHMKAMQIVSIATGPLFPLTQNPEKVSCSLFSSDSHFAFIRCYTVDKGFISILLRAAS